MSRDEKSQSKTKQELDRVVFIGRTFEEYVQMFNLHISELVGKKILDCPAGACSFTALGTKASLDITASDIAYDHKIDDLKRKGLLDIGHAMETLERAKDNYVWSCYGDLLDRLILELEAEGLRVTEAKVPYEFMRNGNSLLSIRKI
ncbi:hypothetical protein [Paenibacillus sp. MZ03-122A]|uniref:hypothetical protein n=1 Tax=Paenibacillus sp. MZ03-122A TaxID=2962033 RepID=UPI0020B7E621|nr:hypothetical protein [Paenibacillus sp. MZ03-122A]MCP3777745.1 hypothetical protein [Paenibacillus sp. MZ03-122A]